MVGDVAEYKLLTMVEKITENDGDSVINIIRNLSEWGKEP
jgi:DNA polymerase-3 subunit gamma/tau